MLKRCNSIIAIWITLAVCIFLTIWGLSNLNWPGVIPFDGEKPLIFYLVFLFITMVLVLLGSMLSKRRPFVVGCAIGLLFAILAGAVGPLLAAIWFIFASAILGRVLVNLFRVDGIGGNNWINYLLIGAGVYGTITGLLAYFPINYPGLYGVLLVIPIVFGWRMCLELFALIDKWIAETQSLESDVKWLEIAITVVGLFYFVVALMPELMHDSLAMHLFVPAQLVAQHQWNFDVSKYVWTVMPMLGDWVYSLGFMIGGETAARLIHICFIFVLAGIVRNIVLWLGGKALGVLWAVLIFISTPIVFAEGSSLFVEPIWSAFLLAGLLSFMSLFDRDSNDGYCIKIGGVMLGFALATKAISFIILPFIAIILLCKFRKLFSKPKNLSVLSGILFFIILGSVPYLIAWHITSNPVFPFYNRFFKSPFYPVENFNNLRYSFGVTWDLLYRIVFNSGNYMEASAGASGFQWILLFLPTIFFIPQQNKYRRILVLVCGVGSLCITFNFQSYLRYVFPQIVLLTAIIGIVFSEELKGKLLSKAFTFIALYTVALNILFITSGTWLYRDFPLKSILSQSDREEYLAEHRSMRRAVEAVNDLNINKLPVAVLGEPLTAGLNTDAFYVNWYNPSFLSEFNLIKTERDLVRLFRDKKIDFFITDFSTNMISKEKIDLINKVSTTVVKFGTVGVCQLKGIYKYQEELVIEPNFNKITGWSLLPGAVFDSNTKTVTVNVSSPAIQRVSIVKGYSYLNTVVARSLNKTTEGRIQVNWLDPNGKTIDSSIQLFGCTPEWEEHSMEVKAPINAAFAEVYASGNTTTPIEFKMVSFKR